MGDNALVKLIARIYNPNLFRYLVVGFSTFGIDLGLLVLLHGKLGVHLAIATSIAYWTSVTFNFTLNRMWTFNVGEKKSLGRHALLYGVLLSINYTFTVVFVSVASHHVNYGIAKVIAVGLQTMWTYPVYRFVIFKTPTPASIDLT